MKNLLQRDKLFLKSLYEANCVPECKRIIQFASDSKLETLIRFLHLISNGDIKIKKENFNALQKKHLKLIKKHLEKKASVQKLLQDERQVKLKILNKFCDVYPQLTYTLFNEV